MSGASRREDGGERRVAGQRGTQHTAQSRRSEPQPDWGPTQETQHTKTEQSPRSTHLLEELAQKVDLGEARERGERGQRRREVAGSRLVWGGGVFGGGGVGWGQATPGAEEGGRRAAPPGRPRPPPPPPRSRPKDKRKAPPLPPQHTQTVRTGRRRAAAWRRPRQRTRARRAPRARPFGGRVVVRCDAHGGGVWGWG